MGPRNGAERQDKSNQHCAGCKCVRKESYRNIPASQTLPHDPGADHRGKEKGGPERFGYQFSRTQSELQVIRNCTLNSSHAVPFTAQPHRVRRTTLTSRSTPFSPASTSRSGRGRSHLRRSSAPSGASAVFGTIETASLNAGATKPGARGRHKRTRAASIGNVLKLR